MPRPASKTTSLLLCLVLGSGSASAFAFDSYSLEFAHGNKTKALRIGAQSDWGVQWLRAYGAHVAGYWDFSLAQWRGSRYENRDENQDITVIGVTPVLRWKMDSGIGPYLEAGVGAHLMSHVYDNNNRQLSGSFQFGSHLGLGYVFRNGLDLGINFRHFSNAGISHPNDGVNFTGFRLAYTF